MSNKVICSKAFTLTELILSIAFAGMLILLAGATIRLSVVINKKSFEREETTAKFYAASYELEKNFSQAMNIVAAGNVSLNNSDAMTVLANGRVRRYNSVSRPLGSVDTIAHFIKESAKSGGNDSRSRLSGVGIYFQNPTADTSGALYIDVQRRAGLVQTRPFQSKIFFDGLVEFQISQIYGPSMGTAASGEPVAGIDIRLVSRIFTAISSNTNEWQWCPQAVIAGNAGCQTRASFKDVERRIHILFRNNIVGNTESDGTEQRPLGPLHFFDTDFVGEVI